ncbi:Apc15p protein-domain-containing protein [Phaeosphaeriaceae sp. PMI808]|nr:Apc15p protein-domain-containing protein [Phaeosphaeriaceae sp. PMI808]
MLSLPMIAPRADASLWPSHRITNTYADDSSNSPPNANQHRPTSHHGHPQQHHHARSSTSALLASLSHDENTIEQRKLNVRRFGAGWIRPPGIAKTLQAMKDEELEKEEQEMMQRREQVMLDLAAAQQDAANAETREEGDIEDHDADEERDLDDEVPEAEASVSESASDSSDGDGESVSADDENDTTVPFNEDSFIEGSILHAEVSHMLEMEEAEMAGVLQDERDLDDDVPEAGSYEHTDSELEDSSEEDASHLLPPGLSSARSARSRRSLRSNGRRVSGRRSSGLPSGGLDLGADLGQGRSSFGLDGSSSIMEGSSFLRSSPAVAASRGSLRDRFLGAVRGARRG